MILVFGGGGQVGQEFSRLARLRNIPLLALSRSQADIVDKNAVSSALQTHRPALVVNAAAYTKVDLAEDEPAAAHRANVVGAASVAEGCAAADIPLVHISTDYVFDGQKTGAYVESDPVAPTGTYGATKAKGEDDVRRLAHMHLILRTAWVYGEFGHNFLKTILRLTRERDELRIVADQRGSPTSTYDLASAILSVAPVLMAKDAPWGTYHFAGSGITTWHGFAARIVAAQAPFTGRNPALLPVTTEEFPTRARRPKNSALDSELFARTFGIAPRPWPAQCDEATRALCEQDRTAPC